MERILFCRIADMKKYAGVEAEEEAPQHGGKWVTDGNTPWESYNFLDIDGHCYGYARPAIRNDRANLARIVSDTSAEFVDGVRVIFFAKRTQGQVIVGWYENARVYAEARTGPKGQRENFLYFFRCPFDSAFLLKPHDRVHTILRGKGGTGQSNWTYVLDEHGTPKSLQWMMDAVQYTKSQTERLRSGRSSFEKALKQAGASAEAECAFTPETLEDARTRIVRPIVLRRGQPAFRKALLEAYGGKCAITGCDYEPALEAAHITPYLGKHTNRVTNGILLRADIHTLFDLGHIAIDTGNWTVVLADGAQGTAFGRLAGKKIHLPADPTRRPNKSALDEHRGLTGL